MTRILIFGSRDWTDEEAISVVLNGYLSDVTPLEVLNGGAGGADRIAQAWADTNVVVCWTLEADWAKHGKGAGPIRNQAMLDEGKPDVAWGFVTKPLEESRGSADMARRARAVGVPTYVVSAG